MEDVKEDGGRRTEDVMEDGGRRTLVLYPFMDKFLFFLKIGTNDLRIYLQNQ